MAETTMKQTSTQDPLARTLAALELSETPAPGMAKISVFSQPVLRKAMVITTCFGLIAGVLQYLYKSGHISVEIKNLYSVFLYIFLFAGGLHIAGYLTPGRFVLILINIAMFQTWEIVFYEKHNYLVFYIVFASWLMLWWMWREPEMMENLGLRKASLLKDFSLGALLSLLILGYILFVAQKFGFEMNYNLRDVAPHTSIMLPQNLVTFNFLFVMWKQLQNKGISQTENILVLALTVNMLFTPQSIAFYASGTVSLTICAGTIFMTTLLFILLITLTFKTMKNTFPAACMSTAGHEALVIIGVL